MLSVKGLVESGRLTSLPPEFIFNTNTYDQNSQDVVLDSETIPTIDLSLLTSGTPDQRSDVVRQLGHACREWGFFMVINHGIERKLKEEVIGGIKCFFDQPEEEKHKYAGKNLFDPIRCGSSFNLAVDQVLLWRDYLKVHVHPNFSAPLRPLGFSEVLQEYCKKTRELAEELLKGLSKSLGMEESFIQEKAEMGPESHQLLVVNMYPPCPQPELAMGICPHSDHGLITILMQNELNGLQVKHKGKWVPVHPLPDSLFVNTGDQMEILTNGEYKSVVHRAVVNRKATRVSVGTAHGPPLDTIVRPAQEMLFRPPLYRGVTYREYMQLQQTNQLDGRSCLDKVRL